MDGTKLDDAGALLSRREELVQVGGHQWASIGQREVTLRVRLLEELDVVKQRKVQVVLNGAVAGSTARNMLDEAVLHLMTRGAGRNAGQTKLVTMREGRAAVPKPWLDCERRRDGRPRGS